MQSGLQLRDLSVKISGRQILSALNLEIAAGDFVTLLGRSGCGKTTLLRAIAGELAVQSGMVVASSNLGFAQQAAPLFPWLTILQNLTLASKEESVLAHARALLLLERVQLKSSTHLRPHQLSGGMRSRASLARAFMNQPEIVLMDEPFNGLDIQTREELQAVTLELWRESKCTILLVSHDLDESIRLSDRVLVLAGAGDRFLLDRRNELMRPRAKKSIDVQQDPNYRKLWCAIQESIP